MVLFAFAVRGPFDVLVERRNDRRAVVRIIRIMIRRDLSKLVDCVENYLRKNNLK